MWLVWFPACLKRAVGPVYVWLCVCVCVCVCVVVLPSTCWMEMLLLVSGDGDAERVGEAKLFRQLGNYYVRVRGFCWSSFSTSRLLVFVFVFVFVLPF